MKARTQAIPNVRLRQQREQRHWTQTELARLIDATYVTVCRWESGATVPSLYHRQKLCAVFGLPAEALGLPGASAAEPTAGPQSAALTSAGVWQVPFRRNPFFTGRDAVLTRLEALLFASKAAALSQTQALSGLGGIGKTQTAVEYAYRHRTDYQAVFWARAETRETLQADLVQVADLLALPERQEQDQRRILAAVKRWLSTHDHWLLILDNVEDLALVEENMPAGAPGRLLLTTRAQATGFIAQRIYLEEMAPAEGALFLLRRAGFLAPDAPLEASAHAQVAQDLSRLLSGLPLALDQAGAYIEETDCLPADYLERYQRHQTTLLQRRGRTREHPESVSTTFALAFQHVQRASPAAADLLRLCAFLAPDAIPEELLTTGAPDLGETLAPIAADPLALDEVYEVLRRSSLVRRHAESQTLTIHRLVQAVLKEGLEEAAQRQWTERAVRAISRAWPVQSYSEWTRYERLLPHALVGTHLIDQHHFAFPEAAHLLLWIGWYLRVRVQFVQAESLMQRALAIREQTLGPEHPDTALVLAALARLHKDQGQYQQAEALYRRALAVRERTLEPEHPDVSDSLYELGGLYILWGQYAEAEPLLLRALTINERTLGAAHPSMAGVLSDLGVLYNYQGRYQEAEPHLRRALAIREQAFGPDHAAVALTLNNLAWLYDAQEQTAQAEPLHRRALAIREQVFGPDHPDVAQSLLNLAANQRAQGRAAQAEPLFRRALAIRQQALGDHHPATANVLWQLGRLYREQGRQAEAEPLLRQALAIREQRFGSEHRQTASLLYELARLYEDQGRSQEALTLYQRALASTEQALGADHPETMAVRERSTRLQEHLECSGNKAERQEAQAQEDRSPGPARETNACASHSARLGDKQWIEQEPGEGG